jgi:hypothetical protein
MATGSGYIYQKAVASPADTLAPVDMPFSLFSGTATCSTETELLAALDSASPYDAIELTADLVISESNLPITLSKSVRLFSSYSGAPKYIACGSVSAPVATFHITETANNVILDHLILHTAHQAESVAVQIDASLSNSSSALVAIGGNTSIVVWPGATGILSDRSALRISTTTFSCAPDVSHDTESSTITLTPFLTITRGSNLQTTFVDHCSFYGSDIANIHAVGVLLPTSASAAFDHSTYTLQLSENTGGTSTYPLHSLLCHQVFPTSSHLRLRLVQNASFVNESTVQFQGTTDCLQGIDSILLKENVQDSNDLTYTNGWMLCSSLTGSPAVQLHQTSLFGSNNTLLHGSTLRSSRVTDATIDSSRYLTFVTADIDSDSFHPFVLGWINEGQRIVGPPGNDGSVYYATGPQGPQGESGMSYTGPQGPQGETGASATSLSTYPIDYAITGTVAPVYTTSSLGYIYQPTLSWTDSTLTSSVAFEVGAIALQTFGSFLALAKVRFGNAATSPEGSTVEITSCTLSMVQTSSSAVLAEKTLSWPLTLPLLLLPGEESDIELQTVHLPSTADAKNLTFQFRLTFTTTSDAVAEILPGIGTQVNMIRLG